MKPDFEDDELDAFLTTQLAAAPLPGEEFSRPVLARVEGAAKRRSRILSGAAWLAAALALGLALLLPAARPGFELTPGGALGALLLLTLCGLVWIGTEPGAPERLARLAHPGPRTVP